MFTKPKPKRDPLVGEGVWFCIIGLTMLSIVDLATSSEPRPSGPFVAIDGDTIEDVTGGLHYRLLGFDAPETYQARCSSELQRGLAAKEKLQSLLENYQTSVTPNGKRDRYNRILATLKIGSPGKDIAEIMISEGFARPYFGGRRQGWCS